MDEEIKRSIDCMDSVFRKGAGLSCENDRGQRLHLGRYHRRPGITAEFEMRGRSERVLVEGLTPEQAVALHGAFCLLSDDPSAKIYDQIGA